MGIAESRFCCLKAPHPMDPREFEQIVDACYADLYRFAYSLARNEADASDLTQQAFAIFAQKGDSLRDASKCKQWLFTALYREFLRQGRRSERIIGMEESELEQHMPAAPAVEQHPGEQADLLDALAALDESHRSILTLFYLQDCSYKSIAETLAIPIGTVMSRLARAKEALRIQMLSPKSKGIKP